MSSNWRNLSVIAFMLLILLKYPLFFIAPFPSGNFATSLYLGSVEQMTAFACFMILIRHKNTAYLLCQLNLWAKIALSGFIIVILFQFIYWHNYSFALFLYGLSWIIIPLTVYLYASEFKRFLLPYFALLWVFNIFHTLWQIFKSKECIGIAANRNWNGAFFIACTPLFFYWLYCLLKAKNFSKKIIISTLVLLSAFSLYALYLTESRGAILALIVVFVLFLCFQLNLSDSSRLKKWGRLLIYGSIIISGLTICILFFSGKISEMIVEDVRIPLWRGALDLFLDHPLFGVGAGSYEGQFAYYIPIERFFRSHNFAHRATHPHNQLLFFAGAFGIFGFIALLYLWFAPIVLFFKRYKTASTLTKLVAFSYLMLVFHSMLDLVAMRWPTMQMLFILQGFLWVSMLRKVEDSLKQNDAERQGFKAFPICGRVACQTAAGLCLVFSIFLLWQNFKISSFSRSSSIASEKNLYVSSLFFNQQAIKYGNESIDTYNAGLRWLFWMNDYYLAYYYFSELEKHPSKIVVHANAHLAECLTLMNRKAEAINYLDREIKAFPLSSIALYKKLLLEKDLGRIDAANRTANKLVKLMKFKGLELKDMKKILADPTLDNKFHRLK